MSRWATRGVGDGDLVLGEGEILLVLGELVGRPDLHAIGDGVSLSYFAVAGSFDEEKLRTQPSGEAADIGSKDWIVIVTERHHSIRTGHYGLLFLTEGNYRTTYVVYTILQNFVKFI